MLTPRIQNAFDYAMICHAGQVRKGTPIPYISHLMAVASIVMEAAADGRKELPEDYEDLVISALLHDVVEDCGGKARLNDVKARFGTRVGDIIKHCTDAEPKPGETKRPWPERKWKYINNFKNNTDLEAVMVSAADKIHNLRHMVADLRFYESNGISQRKFWERFVKNKPGVQLEQQVPQILWYYEQLCHAVEAKADCQQASSEQPGLRRLANEFRAALDDLLELAAKEEGFQPKEPPEINDRK
jgi:5'-deoxynucleotidase YfbR-like HD superfamily hydrolase